MSAMFTPLWEIQHLPYTRAFGSGNETGVTEEPDLDDGGIDIFSKATSVTSMILQQECLTSRKSRRKLKSSYVGVQLSDRLLA